MRDEDGALLRGQLVERGVERVEQNGARVRGLRPCVPRRQQILERQRLARVVVACARLRQRLRFLLAEEVRDPVACHAVEPGADLVDGPHQPLRLDQL